MEEAELVRKMISGDKDAFAGLMEIYQKQALRAAYRSLETMLTARISYRRPLHPAISTGSRSGTRRPLRAGSIRPCPGRPGGSAGRPDGNSLQRKCIRRKKRLRAGF